MKKNNTLFKSYLITFVLINLFLFNSCRSLDRIFTGTPEGEHSGAELVELLIKNQPDYNTMYFQRMLVNFKSPDNNHSSRANMFIKKNEEIIISIIPFLGIEAFRVRMTQNGLEIIDRLNKEVLFYSFKKFEEIYSYELNFQLIQNILTNNVFVYPNNDINRLKRFKGDVSGDHYTLYNDNYSNFFSSSSVFQQFNILSDIFRISQAEIRDLKENFNLKIEYLNFHKLESGLNFPNEIFLSGTNDQEQITLTFKFNNIEINSDRSLAFSIPSNYEYIEF